MKLRAKDENRNIEHALNIALDNNDIHTARVLSWCITTNFYHKHQEALSNAVNIYPGVRCICKTKDSRKRVFCSKSLVIVVLQQEVRQLPQEFRGFDIEPVSLYDLQRSEGNVILEYLVRKRKDSFHLKVGISNERAQTLLLNHGNLGMICPSIGRSRYFSSKHHTIADEVCVQLHCSKKGIIPIGNEHFPITINGYPTDVIESQPYLLSNLRIGDEVSSQTSSGTLGGFVEYLDFFGCFLTCAHVMYDQQTLLDSSSELPGAAAYINTQHGPIQCGNVIRPIFDYDDQSRTSVDAALVLLNNAFSVNPDNILRGSKFPRTCHQLG